MKYLRGTDESARDLMARRSDKGIPEGCAFRSKGDSLASNGTEGVDSG